MRPVYVAGFGFRQRATLDSFRSAFNKAAHGFEISAIAVPIDKIDNPALYDFANEQGLAIYPAHADAMRQAETETRSPVTLEKRHTGSVAEAAALAIFKDPSTLVATRQISDDRLAVCAVAKGLEI